MFVNVFCIWTMFVNVFCIWTMNFLSKQTFPVHMPNVLFGIKILDIWWYEVMYSFTNVYRRYWNRLILIQISQHWSWSNEARLRHPLTSYQRPSWILTPITLSSFWNNHCQIIKIKSRMVFYSRCWSTDLRFGQQFWPDRNLLLIKPTEFEAEEICLWSFAIPPIADIWRELCTLLK